MEDVQRRRTAEQCTRAAYLKDRHTELGNKSAETGPHFRREVADESKPLGRDRVLDADEMEAPNPAASTDLPQLGDTPAGRNHFEEDDTPATADTIMVG